MKHSLLKLFTILLMSSMLFSITRPSIEGRASVADAGDLPSGMYIKAHTFLPGDTVIITNPSTKVSVEVLVFETIDEGVAAVVSQEVAEKLFITQNSDTMVQIRKVIASADIAEAGILLESEKALLLASDMSEEFIDDSEIFIAETSIVTESSLVDDVEVNNAEVEVVESEIEESEFVSPLFDEPEVVLEDSSYEEIAIEETLPYNEEELEILETATIVEVEKEPIASSELAEEDSEITDDNALVFTPFSDMTSLFESSSIEDEVLIEESVEVAVIEDEIPQVSIFTEPVFEDISVEELPIEETAALVVEEEPIVETTEAVVEDGELEENAEIALTDVIDEVSIFEEPVFEELIEETIIEESAEITILETPNTLTPTEENPPIFDGIEDEPEVTLNTEYSFEVPVDEHIEIAVEETVDIFALTPATEYVEEVPAFSGNLNNYIVESISVDGARKYYIQLATYKDTSNINTILVNYSEKYPLALLRSPVVNGAYQVVVGPLTKDEYTVVLERFKSYGYKDAYLRIAE